MQRWMIQVFAFLIMVGCGEGTVVPPPPSYDPCETPSDCPPEEPVCGALLVGENDVRRMCTTHCTASDQCHSFSGQITYNGICVPVDEGGVVVETFDGAICLRDCSPERRCPFGYDCAASSFAASSFCVPVP